MRPAGVSLPSSQNTTSAKVRWMVDVHTNYTAYRLLLSSVANGSSGLHDNYGSALSAQPGRSRGRPATNASSRLIEYIGLPTLRAPGAPRPDGRTIRRRSADLSRTSGHRDLHTGYQRYRGLERQAALGGRGQGPFPSDEAATKLLFLVLNRPKSSGLSNGEQSGPRIASNRDPSPALVRACPGSEQEGPAPSGVTAKSPT
jgi:hypothetical protein